MELMKGPAMLIRPSCVFTIPSYVHSIDVYCVTLGGAQL